MDQQEDDANLIHLPLFTLESLLEERPHPTLQNHDLSDLDAQELFEAWAVRRGYLNSTHVYDDVSESDKRRRRLQDIIGDGTHFVKVYVGNPAQVRVLALSNGADFTAWPCEDCYNCGNLIEPYFHSKSQSFSTMPCGRCASSTVNSDACDSKREKCIVSGASFFDSSSTWAAYESRDYIYIGGAEDELAGMDPRDSDVAERFGFPMVFGCQTEALGWFSAQVHDGILGLSTAKTSFVNQMVFQDKLKYPRFSMCFQHGTMEGLVTLGGFNPKTLDSPMVYVQNVEGAGGTGFKVFVRNIYFRKGGGQKVISEGGAMTADSLVRLNMDSDAFNAKNEGTVVDSGFPGLVLDESIQEIFLNEWHRMTGQDFTSFGKMALTQNELMALPTLIFQIKAHDGVDKSFDPNSVPSLAGERDPQHPFDVMIAIPASRYLEFIPAIGTYRSKITLDSKIGSFIGMAAMEGHAFYYDLTTDRIGMAESFTCGSKNGMLGLGFGDDDMYGMNLGIYSGTSPWGYNGNGPGNGYGDGDGSGTSIRGVGKGGPSFYDQKGANCTSATCISFVTVGYAVVATALAVAYNKYKPKDRSKKFEESLDDSDTSVRETETLAPVFQQNANQSGLV